MVRIDKRCAKDARMAIVKEDNGVQMRQRLELMASGASRSCKSTHRGPLICAQRIMRRNRVLGTDHSVLISGPGKGRFGTEHYVAARTV